MRPRRAGRSERATGRGTSPGASVPRGASPQASLGTASWVDATGMSKECHWHVKGMPPACLRNATGMSEECHWHVKGMPPACQRNATGMPLAGLLYEVHITPRFPPFVLAQRFFLRQLPRPSPRVCGGCMRRGPPPGQLSPRGMHSKASQPAGERAARYEPRVSPGRASPGRASRTERATGRGTSPGASVPRGASPQARLLQRPG